MRHLTIFLFLLILPFSAVADHYQTLGVDRNAESKEIERAYRKLALKFHPDRNRGNEEAAGKKFIVIQEAFEVLHDEDQRRAYDRTIGTGIQGFDGVNPHPSTGRSSDRPEGAIQDVDRRWYYYDWDQNKVFFDPKTGFPEGFHYNPKTKSSASDLFDELLNPRNLGKRQKLIEKAVNLEWTAEQKKDFLARASEVLRATTTDEMYPSNENYRRMNAVFDLPFILDYPDFIINFLETHPRYRGVFQNDYLTDPQWMAHKAFPQIFELARQTDDRGLLPLSIIGTVRLSAGKKTGRILISPFDHQPYEEREIVREQTIDYAAFKKWVPLFVKELEPRHIGRLADVLACFFEGEGLRSVLPEIQIIMQSAAFKKAENDPKKDQYTARMIALLKNKIASFNNLPGQLTRIALPAPNPCPDIFQKLKKNSRQKKPTKKKKTR